MGEWILKRAASNDVNDIKLCIDEAYAPFKERIEDLPDVSNGIEQDISDHYVWIAKGEQKLVGVIIALLSTNGFTIANIAVSPDMKGQGLGRALMKLVEDEARALKFENLWLSTHKDVPENVALYKHLGWTVTSHKGNKVTMTKVI